MIESHKEAFQELRTWCQKYGAIIKVSNYHSGHVSIQIDDGNFRSYFVGQFDKARGSVLTDLRERV